MTYIKILFLLIVLTNCTEDTIVEKDSFSLSGIIFEKDVPSSETTVQLFKNNEVVYETSTDINGHYEFLNVSKGEYIISPIKFLRNGSFISYPQNISINKDVVLEDIKLPDPITLLEPIEITNSSVTLIWSKYSLDNYYEIKIYRDTLSGTNETIGTLIYESKEKTDTTFIDRGEGLFNGLSPNTNYYYRVYIKNEFGILASSQELNVKTKSNKEMFKNYFPLKIGNLWEYQSTMRTSDLYLYKDINQEIITITKIEDDSTFLMSCSFSGKSIKSDPVSGQIMNTTEYFDQKCKMNFKIINSQLTLVSYDSCSSNRYPIISYILQKIKISQGQGDTLKIDNEVTWDKLKYTMVKDIGLTEGYYSYFVNHFTTYECKLSNYLLK